MKHSRLIAAPVALMFAVTAAGCAEESKKNEASGPCRDASPAAVASPIAVAAPDSAITVQSDSRLPRLPLRDLLRQQRPSDRPVDDRGIALGGIGSDIFPAAAPDEYWMITDRGPNGKIKTEKGDARSFPVPSFDPMILRARVAGNKLEVLETIPITDTAGQGVTGLSNVKARDELAYDLSGTDEIPVNPAGLDPEGMVRTPNGEFWISEEYAPSILRIGADGKVLARYIPEGLDLPDPGYPVFATLPAILAKRQLNRGFESMAISPDGGTVFAALQSPLALPDEQAGGKSRAVRLLAVSTQTGRPTAEYVYPFEEVSAFDSGAKGKQSEMKLSGLAWYGPNQLLVDERTDDVAKLYVAQIDPAKNILGSPFDDPNLGFPLESTDINATKPLTKTPLVDLSGQIAGLPKKIEGIAVRDPKTIVVANDNDFGLIDGRKAFDAEGQVCDSGVASRVLVLKLK